MTSIAQLQPPLTWHCQRAAQARHVLPRPWQQRTIARATPQPEGNSEAEPPRRRSELEITIRRKQAQVEAQLKELGIEALEQRLQDSVKVPASPPFRLSTLIAESVPQGKCVLVFELTRPSPSSTSAELVKLAKQLVAMGADALVVPVDAEDSPTGLQDLFSVCQAIRNVPVMAKDWMIHPLQVLEIKQAGAAGVLGVISQVNGRGTAVMSSFSAAMGLDAPVEVVNVFELEPLAKAGVVFYGINLSVGLSVSIPGFSKDVVHGILGKLPFGAVSMVGVRSIEEASRARLSGADCLFIKRDLIQQYNTPEARQDPFGRTGIRRLVEELQSVTNGDD